MTRVTHFTTAASLSAIAMVNRVIIQIPSLSWRLVPNFIKVSAGIGLIALVAACSSPGANALSNPNYFLAKVNKKAQVMSGQYNP
ncbi:MAG: hypothetical protein NXH84_16320, partial [Rhodobacteraceae bacterium]|nr:hypothetical protein [Paracoccaceae bacterium]